jgi:hypothetical protein
LPHMPKFRLKKRTHRDKSSLLKLLRHVPTMRETRNKRLANKPPAADQDNIPPCTIPNIKGTMNPTLVFGLQVETLISRDKAMLEREKISASEPDSLNSTILQRKRAVEHAKLVVKQIGQRSSKRRCAKRSGKISDQNTEIFRFMGLPPEIRDMIYTCYFMNSSGEKPRLMWAFKINGVKIKGDFYDAAEKVYYTVNSWTFSIRDCLKNSILGSMDQFHVEMIRKMTIEIP